MNKKIYDKKDLIHGMRRPDGHHCHVRCCAHGRICRDCLVMYWIPVLFYAAELVVGEVLHTYSATVLGGFADYALGGSMEEGMADLRRILVSVGLSIVLPLLFSVLGEVTMFKASLGHSCRILERFLGKTFEAAGNIRGSEAQYRLEDDQTQLGITWVNLMMWGISLPIVATYLLYWSIHTLGWFTAVVFGVCLLKLFLPLAMHRVLEKYDLQERECKSGIRGLESEMVGKPVQICLYGLQGGFLKRLERAMGDYRERVFAPKSACETRVDQVTAQMDTVCLLLILVSGAAAVSLGGLSVGAIVAMSGYYYIFNVAIDYVVKIIKNVPLCKNLVKRISLFYTDAENTEGVRIQRVESIVLKGIGFAYGENEVFTGLRHQVRMGARTAVCGRNGSGKSTLIKLLCGLYPGYQGEIRVNGMELREISMDSWREKCAYVEQSPYLFQGTVWENVRLGRLDAGQEEVWEAVRRVGLENLAEREISDDQEVLSGGERQRISIARALLRKADILLMDEPGNNLDEKALSWLQGFIRDYRGTMLFISHDETMLALADEAIRLD